MAKTILAVGGTGRLGRPVAERLASDGYRVRVLTRYAQAAGVLFDKTFELIEGDVTDVDTVAAALDGCLGVHINLRGSTEQIGTENVTKVAARVGVQRISYISGLTVCQQNGWFEMVARKLRAEAAIVNSEVPYCIFCPTWFMEVLPHFVVGKRATLIGKSHGPYHWVAADDYAQMVAESYALDEVANSRIAVCGPKAATVREALDRYIAKLHPGVKGVTAYSTGFSRFLGTVTFNRGLKDLARQMTYFEKAGETGDAETSTILKAPTTTLDEWIDRRLAQQASAETDD